jgi:hypothetical protein
VVVPTIWKRKVEEKIMYGGIMGSVKVFRYCASRELTLPRKELAKELLLLKNTV